MDTRTGKCVAVPNFAPMEKSVDARKTGLQTTVFLYGLAMAALVFILKYVEYRYWIRDGADRVSMTVFRS